MEINFYKYHGTGNDFVLVDQIKGNKFDLTTDQIALICDRRFGIGADGFMFLRPSDTCDFEMVYFNSDGNISTMCGNGGRCIVKFAHDRGHIKKNCVFTAIDGLHEAHIIDEEVSLGMIDVSDVKLKKNGDYELFTGSPHYVHFDNDGALENIYTYGRSIRYGDEHAKEGINVNIVSPADDHIRMATYERGVEDETYSCGTGVVAAVLSHSLKSDTFGTTNVKTKGGNLSVTYEYDNKGFTNIKLIGPAKFVFKGKIEI